MSNWHQTWKHSASTLILRAVFLLSFVGWLIVALFYWKLGAPRAAYLLAGWLFFGLYLAWLITIKRLKKKGVEHVESLLREISEEEGKELEKSLSGIIEIPDKD